MEQRNDQLGEAFSRLTIVQLAMELGLELKRGAGQKSPFRDDKKAGSFSVQDDYFKDHACPEHSGGHIKFVMLARPQFSKKEAIEFIIRAAGIEPEPFKPGTMRRIDKENRQKLFKKRDMELNALPKMPQCSLWSDDVMIRWIDGQTAFTVGGAAALEKFGQLAASRGWSMAVIEWLIRRDKMSTPCLPWGNKRGCAFIVEKPVFKPGGQHLGLVPIGYHQRWIKKTANGLQKNWTYVPYIPQEPGNDFQTALKTDGKSCPAFPFVLGDTGSAKLVIMTEGQWDAISIAAAFGWLDDWPDGICILALRGVQGHAPLLAGYGAWLQKHKPFVWYLGDNDAAGAKVLERTNPEQITAGPSFIDRLRALGCKVYTMFLDVEGCKDFNDIYKAHGWGKSEMQKLADVAGCGDLVKGGQG